MWPGTYLYIMRSVWKHFQQVLSAIPVSNPKQIFEPVNLRCTGSETTYRRGIQHTCRELSQRKIHSAYPRILNTVNAVQAREAKLEYYPAIGLVPYFLHSLRYRVPNTVRETTNTGYSHNTVAIQQ